VWRNLNWYTTNGQSVALTDERILNFGGTEGRAGQRAELGVGLVAAAAAVLAILSARRAKQRHGFAVKPMWAEGALLALIVGAILGFVAILNAYPIPESKLRRAFEARARRCPKVRRQPRPAGVGAAAHRGGGGDDGDRAAHALRPLHLRHGGNPDAAALSGIDNRWLTLKVFALMGFLCGLAAWSRRRGSKATATTSAP
jgi:D-xylose transport system permease protein